MPCPRALPRGTSASPTRCTSCNSPNVPAPAVLEPNVSHSRHALLLLTLTWPTASADRRPVDPPPIVEIKIYEGENAETDITHQINANYFLFATLEQARPIANGRLPEDKKNVTVLTGTAVSGMVLLDKPAPAGYFIFPDLSVRHEGKYRLSFSLYEEIKCAEDADKSDMAVNPSDHVVHRMEIKSEPFIVYSAKKFPGLAESTALSRTVASQGCRVRIRQDVRMRRRETKPGKDWDAYEDETAPARAKMQSATPEVPPYGHPYMDSNGRPRSSSNASHQSLANPLSRRTSLQDMSQQYQQPQQQPYGGMPRPTQPNDPQPAHYAPPPGAQYSQPMYPQAHGNMGPPPQFSQQPAPQPQMTTAPPQHSYYGYASQSTMPLPAYESPPHSARPNADYAMQPGVDESRRSSAQFGSVPAQPSYFTSPAPQPAAMYSNQNTFARPQPVQPPAAQMPLTQLPPLQIPDQKITPSSPASSVPQSSYYSSTEPGHKRSYGNVFNESHIQQPLRDGARPSLPFSSISNGGSIPTDFGGVDDQDATDECDGRNGLTMQYRRADGSMFTRALPPHNV